MPFITARVISVIRDDVMAALAFAGDNQSVLCASLVQLEGEIIGDDIANHTFEWEQTFGTPVTLINPNTLTPSFVNPQVSDLEFTLWLDRNTPYEDSDVVVVSRAPTDFMTTGLGGGTSGTMGIAGVGVAGTARAGVSVSTELINDAHVTGWAFTNPPTARYSPIFKASDLDRVRENLNGQYWLMKDIDLSEYDNWNPIGTATRPFSGELQGNGFKIDGLTINSQPVDATSIDPNVKLLAHFDGADDQATTIDSSSSAQTITLFNSCVLDTAFTVFGPSSLYAVNSPAHAIVTSSPDLALGSGDWTIEFRFRPDGDPGGAGIIYDQRAGGAGVVPTIYLIATNSIRYHVNGVDRITASGISGTTWYNFALSKVSGTTRMYIDGSQVGSSYTDGHTYLQNPLYLCEAGDAPGGGFGFQGHLEELRVTVGVGRYSGTSYTVTTDAFSINSYKDAGIFSYIGNGALIEKVGITNATISGVGSSIYKGILAGQASADVTVRDCYVEGTVASGGDKAGGLIGHTGTNASSIYENTYADVTVTGGGTDTGGWAGTFSATPTYIENYSNTTKTAAVVGTGAPAGTEVSGLTTAQLTAEANYTGWDFVSTWEIDEGVTPATLQQDTSYVRATGECDDQWMVIWDKPSVLGAKSYGPAYTYKGAIIEEALGSGWGFSRFIPVNRAGGLMTPATTHRITSVWDYTPDAPNVGQTSSIEEIRVINDKKFTSKETSASFGPYGNDAVGGVLGAGIVATTVNLVITIANPRKISMAESDTGTFGDAGTAATAPNVYVLRTQGRSLPLLTDIMNHGSGGTETYSENIVITRLSGASIG